MEEGRRWEDLKTDCLVRVFERLQLDDLTVGAGLVCSSWHRASLSPECWKILNFQMIDFTPWGKFAQRFMHEYRSRSLSFRSYMKFAVNCSQRSAVEIAFPSEFMANLEDVLHVADECPRLKVLALPKLSPEEDKCTPALIAKWKDLQCLEMAAKPSSFLQLLTQISLNCKNFAELKMSSGCIATEDASAIVSLVPKLKHFSLSNGYICKEEMLVILNGCKELKTFKAIRCIGFGVDDEIRKKASGIELFDCRGSKLCYGLGWIENDEDYIEVV